MESYGYWGYYDELLHFNVYYYNTTQDILVKEEMKPFVS